MTHVFDLKKKLIVLSLCLVCKERTEALCQSVIVFAFTVESAYKEPTDKELPVIRN